MNRDQIPIIRLWDVVLVPLSGDVPDHQAEQLTDDVLRHIERHGPRGLVIELSGVGVVDSHLCSLVANLAAAAELMGTRSFISGIGAEVAVALEMMGVSLRRMSTTCGLEEALDLLDIGPREERE